MLYSRQQHAWKVADFGLSTEGTAVRAKTTVLGRGTPGYRAPELLREEHATFNNKVDIWAMGCILYQIIENEIRAIICDEGGTH